MLKHEYRKYLSAKGVDGQAQVSLSHDVDAQRLMQNEKYLQYLRDKLQKAANGQSHRESQADLPTQLRKVNREVESITRLPDL